MRLLLAAVDPGGDFLEREWDLPAVPRVGEHVMLPAGEDWQEIEVEQVFHYPDKIEVWLGGTTGWEPGSVKELFENEALAERLYYDACEPHAIRWECTTPDIRRSWREVAQGRLSVAQAGQQA